jgi:hypothetical protein
MYRGTNLIFQIGLFEFLFSVFLTVDFSILRAERECQMSFKIKRLGNYFLIFLFIFRRLGKNIEYRYNTNRYSYAYQRYGNSKVGEHIIISLFLIFELKFKKRFYSAMLLTSIVCGFDLLEI